MNDLNLFHAQNADLKSRVSDTGLACDSPASAPDRKAIEAFEMAMRDGSQHFNAFPMQRQEAGYADEAKQNFNGISTQKPEGKYTSDALGDRADSHPELEQSNHDANPQAQLSSLFSMVSTFNDVEAPATVVAPHAVLTEDDLNMLVERILVSAANDGTQEVRLMLNERVLSGTEIVLNRSLTGQLVVTLHCPDASTFQTLVGAQFDLKQMLETREANPVQISVDIHQDGNDAERRSQGYFEYEPDQLWKRDNA